MLKYFVFVAILANAFFLVSSTVTGTEGCGEDPNAQLGCGCSRRCSDTGAVACAKTCTVFDKCECKFGFVYDDYTKRCVYPSECTSSSSIRCYKDEVYVECPNMSQPTHCSQLGSSLPVPGPSHDGRCPTKPACLCAKGKLRNYRGDCVPIDECPNCNRPNENYEPCASDCPPQTCESIGKVYPCPLSKICHGACRCKFGHLRNYLGECIAKEDCLKCKKPHEYFTCGGVCDNVCSNLSKQNQSSCPYVNKQCNRKCYCEKGYARNADGICVPFKDCEPECEENEEYSPCAKGGCYDTRKCSELGGPTFCFGPSKCEEGCVCKKGYYKNDDNVCVTEKECRGNCSDTEIFSNCTLGLCRNELCSQKDNPTACPAIPLPCEQGCVCQKNYRRAPNGICIPEDKCPKEPTCGVNEFYDYCPPCSLQLCDKRIKIKCLPYKQCRPACRCKEGYLRNVDGVCVPKHKCGCNGDPNATTGCGMNCGNLCSNYDSPEPIFCTALCRSNECDCKKGYVFDTIKRKCVHPRYCSPETRKNEVYSDCVEAECRPAYCEEKDFPVICVPREECDCTEGYVCRSGYYRTYNETCVPAADCDVEYDYISDDDPGDDE